MQTYIKLVHHVEGRSRFSLSPDLLPMAKDILEKYFFKTGLEVRPSTGGLVLYHKASLTELLDYLRKNRLPVSSLPPPGPPAPLQLQKEGQGNLGDYLRGTISNWNKKVEKASDGQITLKGLILVSLVGLGVYQIFWKGKILPAGMNLLLFAGNLLLKSGDLPLTEALPDYDPRLKEEMH